MSYVVTGGGRGIGRAVAERLSEKATVVVIEKDPAALDWVDGPRLKAVAGDAARGGRRTRRRPGRGGGAPRRMGQQRRRLPHHRDRGRSGADLTEPRPRADRLRHGRTPLPGRRHRRSDRQRLLTPGRPRRAGLRVLRDRQGRDRGPDQGTRRGVRSPAASASTRSRRARSRPSGTRSSSAARSRPRGSRTRWPPSTRSAVRRRSRRRSPTCCPRTRASSPARPCRWTAACGARPRPRGVVGRQ